MKKKIILIGGGGHCKSCIDVIEQAGMYGIAGIVDVPEKLHQRILGYEIIATDNDLSRIAKEYEYFLITMGQIKSPETRIRLFETLKTSRAKFPVVISPLAYISRHTKIEEGTIIMHQAVVNAGANIGKNCIVNTRVLIEHDAIIEDHCHIATTAVINGGARVGAETFLGSGAIICENIKVGKRCIIGTGAVVNQDIPDFSKVAGIPAKPITAHRD